MVWVRGLGIHIPQKHHRKILKRCGRNKLRAPCAVITYPKILGEMMFPIKEPLFSLLLGMVYCTKNMILLDSATKALLARSP